VCLRKIVDGEIERQLALVLHRVELISPWESRLALKGLPEGVYVALSRELELVQTYG